MSKLIIRPNTLSAGTSTIDNFDAINQNFLTLDADFTGFSSTAQPSATHNVLFTTRPAGSFAAISVPVYSNAEDDLGIVAIPEISIFIDPPPNSSGGYDLPLSINDLYPSGANMTSSKLALISSSYVSQSNTGFDSSDGITDDVAWPTSYRYGSLAFTANGVSYYPTNLVILTLRNVSAATHTYVVQVTAAVYSSNGSQFR